MRAPGKLLPFCLPVENHGTKSLVVTYLLSTSWSQYRERFSPLPLGEVE
jgi:hypothetical protein